VDVLADLFVEIPPDQLYIHETTQAFTQTGGREEWDRLEGEGKGKLENKRREIMKEEWMACRRRCGLWART